MGRIGSALNITEEQTQRFLAWPTEKDSETEQICLADPKDTGWVIDGWRPESVEVDTRPVVPPTIIDRENTDAGRTMEDNQMWKLVSQNDKLDLIITWLRSAGPVPCALADHCPSVPTQRSVK